MKPQSTRLRTVIKYRKVIGKASIALAALLCFGAPPAAERADRVLPATLAAPVENALEAADSHLDHFIEQWIRIAEIPAPSGEEERRAAHIEGRFRELGLADVHRDTAGNVIGRLRAAAPGGLAVAVLAHLDTVASGTADHRVERLPGGRLRGPGVRDDSSGLAGVLAVLELMRNHGLTPAADTWFVGTVQEEVGLHGAERFVSDHEEELGAVIAVDGHLGQISHAATGIVWLKLHFTAKGAHTLRAYAEPSTILAAARAIADISELDLRRTPEEMESWLNIGMMGGGDVPNAQARDAWFTVDLRSNDPATLTSMEERAIRAGRGAAGSVGVGFEHETLHRMPGGRVAGSETSPLVMAAREVLERLKWTDVEVTMRGTADHNVAISRRIPAIAIGMTTGGATHTPEEYAETAPFPTGVKQLLLLVLSPVIPADARLQAPVAR